MKVGLVGFPGSGKTTVFNALTGQQAEIGYSGKGLGKTNLAVVKVPDPRIDALADLYKPRKTTRAEVVFVDVAAPPGVAGRSLDASAIVAMREVDALAAVVRGFPSAEGAAADPVGELSDLATEMTIGDLAPIEKRLERLKKEKAKPGEQDLLLRCKAHLDQGGSLRDLPLSESELQLASGYRFLTRKPLLVVYNVAESDIVRPLPAAVQAYLATHKLTAIPLCGQLEMDLAALSEAEQKAFLADVGLEQPAVNRFISSAYGALDLISFLTAGEDECRAWTIQRGTIAQRAAGKIHSDIERGFIRAEVMSFDDLMKYRSEVKVREAGRARLEGKEYVVRDGDIIHFRHAT